MVPQKQSRQVNGKSLDDGGVHSGSESSLNGM